MAYRSQRAHRYEVYRNAGFLPFECVELSGVRFSEAPYLRKMIRDRIAIKQGFEKEADYNKWSKTRREEEYRKVIRFEYVERRWVRESQVPLIGRTAYRASPWEMLRDYRQRAIDRGEYHPVKKKEAKQVGDKIYTHIYKGDVQAQKARARQRMRDMKGTPQHQRYLEQRRAQKARARQRAKALGSPLSDRQ